MYEFCYVLFCSALSLYIRMLLNVANAFLCRTLILLEPYSDRVVL